MALEEVKKSQGETKEDDDFLDWLLAIDLLKCTPYRRHQKQQKPLS